MSTVNWPFHGRSALSIERASGVHLYTAAGDEILDAAGGAIVANIGHGRQRVVDKVAEATLNYTYVVPPWITPSRRALVDALEADWLPAELSRIHITSGGSEAVESALKLALQYHAARGETSRSQIISRSVSYHGTTVATTAISGHPARKKGLEHALAQYPSVATPYPLRCELGSHHPDAGRYYADLVRETILSAGPETVAGFLAEPISGSSGGAIVPPADYWPRVRKICDEFDVLLILDEVMTGFGRTGLPFGYQHWSITPDILVSGKGLAGGYAPLGGVFATEAIGSAIETAGMNVMFHTFGAHPAACAAGAEVLNIIVEERLIERAARMGTLLHDRLVEVFAEHPHVAEVRGEGLLQAIEVVADRDTLLQFPIADNITSRIVAKGLENGVFYYGGGTGEVRDIICMGPPFIVDESHIAIIADVLLESVNAIV
ncbi:MAG: aminotransferase class III-fold pyridoxal phosphate-dependent enzyme [Pseudomonadales bacterium]|jgi:adenosylmethionine-8-amino-7-oxononanoate aminotransferase